MPGGQPSYNQVHVNAPLTNISVAYMQNAANFISARVFPQVPVQKQSDRYFTYSRADFNRVVAAERAPATESVGSGWNIDNTPTYYARVIAVHKDIDDQTRQNADAPLNMDRDATEFVTQQLLLKRETDWASRFFTTGVWATDQVGGVDFTQWDDPNSTPIEDITNEEISIAQLTGFRPNKLVLSPYVYNSLRNHPDVLDRIKYTQRGIVTTEIMAGLFDVDEVLVPFAIENTAAEGAAEDSQFIYGKGALLVYAAPRPSILQPTGGYIFSWVGLIGAGAFGNRIKRMRMEWLESDRIEGEMSYDIKLVGADLGCFFSNAVS